MEVVLLVVLGVALLSPRSFKGIFGGGPASTAAAGSNPNAAAGYANNATGNPAGAWGGPQLNPIGDGYKQGGQPTNPTQPGGVGTGIGGIVGGVEKGLASIMGAIGGGSDNPSGSVAPGTSMPYPDGTIGAPTGAGQGNFDGTLPGGDGSDLGSSGFQPGAGQGGSLTAGDGSTYGSPPDGGFGSAGDPGAQDIVNPYPDTATPDGTTVSDSSNLTGNGCISCSSSAYGLAG